MYSPHSTETYTYTYMLICLYSDSLVVTDRQVRPVNDSRWQTQAKERERKERKKKKKKKKAKC